MNNFDRMLSSEDVMRRRASFLQRIHVDGPLLIILLTLAAGSLFVLYSASGKNWDLLLKQATSFGIGWCRCSSSPSWSRASWRAGCHWRT